MISTGESTGSLTVLDLNEGSDENSPLTSDVQESLICASNTNIILSRAVVMTTMLSAGIGDTVVLPCCHL